MQSKTAHTIEIIAVVLNSIGMLAAALAGSLSPTTAAYASTIGVAALAAARGLSNLNTSAPAAPFVVAAPAAAPAVPPSAGA